MAPAPQPVDQIELPQRVLHVEGVRHDPPDQVAQLVEAAGPGDRDVAHVAPDVEAGLVSPDRVLDPERDLDDPLAEPGNEVEPVLDVLDQLVVGGRRALGDDHATDVDVDLPPLGEQGRHV